MKKEVKNMDSKESFMENMMNHPSAQAGFTKIYADGIPPWEIGKPQPPFIEVAEQVIGPVLDSGCGTGNTALYFASRGLNVTGIDFVEKVIRQARDKAIERGLSVRFLVKDAMTLCEWGETFASVIDSGLFHIYHGDEQRRYVQGLAHVLKPGGRLFLFSFSDKIDESLGLGGVSKRELYDTFADGWEIESLELVRGEGNPELIAKFPELDPANGDPKMWFAIIRRK
jgi:SAM-dependent methyltransferase